MHFTMPPSANPYAATFESIFGKQGPPSTPTNIPADPRDRLAELRYWPARGLPVPWRRHCIDWNAPVTRKQLARIRRDVAELARAFVAMERGRV